MTSYCECPHLWDSHITILFNMICCYFRNDLHEIWFFSIRYTVSMVLADVLVLVPDHQQSFGWTVNIQHGDCWCPSAYARGPLLLIWFYLNPSMDNELHPLWSVRCNYLSIKKLQRFRSEWVSMLRLGLNCHVLADNIFECIFFNENLHVLLIMLLHIVSSALSKNELALVQIMVSHQTDFNPLSELMMAYFTDTYVHDLASIS